MVSADALAWTPASSLFTGTQLVVFVLANLVPSCQALSLSQRFTQKGKRGGCAEGFVIFTLPLLNQEQ
jgi:hypothetical protein